MLIGKISNAQQGNQSDMLFLIEKFTPLLRRYARKLHTEDALSELILAFIELVQYFKIDAMKCTSDGAIVNYIAVSIRNEYNMRLRKEVTATEEFVSWDDYIEANLHQAGVINPLDEIDQGSFVEFLSQFSTLSEKEKFVLTAVYQNGYSSTALSEVLQTSKQNINQIKLRAQKKIKERLKTEGRL